MNKRILGLVIPVVVILLVLGFLYYLNESDVEVIDNSQLDYNLSPEKEITHITSGVIKSDTLIAVRFRENQVSLRDINQPIKNEGIFTFEPGIKGQIFWKDRRTIVFKPDNPLLERNKYIGTINLKALFPGINGLNPEKQIFEFETLGQAIVSFDGDFQMLDEETVIFTGGFKLAEKTELEKIKQALKLMEGDQEVKLEISSESGLYFSFESEAIQRTSQERNFLVTIDQKTLKLGEPFSRKYTLSPVGELQVIRIEEERQGNSTKVRIVFSDELDNSLNYQGFVGLEPAIDFQTEVDGKALVLKGDFAPGQKYQLSLFSGIRSKLGKELVTGKDYDLELEISDINPAVEFANSGMFLTSARDKKIAFRTINLSRVHLKIKRVEEENLISFFEETSYQANDNNFDEYSKYGFQRIGEILESRILELGRERNKWIQSELDLSHLIDSEKSTLYIIQLEFDEDDALYFPAEWDRWRIRDYVWRNGRKVKHLILSDIGITAKKTPESTHVFVTNILDTTPLENASVILKGKDNQVIETTYTDRDGYAVLRNSGEYIEVKKRYQFSILKFKETRLDTSLFDVEGTTSQGGIKAFIYSDRGVYRPGDTINLAVIARNEEDTFPGNHPVTLKVYNPKNKMVYEETRRDARDGFYTFSFATETTALTGNWNAELKIGNGTFSRILPVEEVVPYRIKVKLEPEKDVLTLEDKEVNFTVSARYLFGTPAEGLESETRVRVEPYEVGFERFKNFTFANESIDFQTLERHSIYNLLDENGKAEVSWKLPEIMDVPSALRVRLDTKVLEKGGRSVPATTYIPIKHYERYVGIKRLENNGLEMGNKARFDVVLVSADGEPVAGKELKYRIYRMRKYWWWEYDDRSSFRRHYKTDTATELVKEGTVTTTEGIVSITYDLSDYGEVLIEVEDVEGGHTAGYFFRSYWWGDGETADSADIINIKADKAQYFPGEVARLLIRTPDKGRALVTIEKAGKVLFREWKELQGSYTELKLEIKEEYIPNVYVSITIFQPYQETVNDMPVRMYGIIPLLVEKRDARLNFEIEAPQSVEPGGDFEVKISSEKRAQFTIAVVDEGLLDITGFKTPDPWEFFFQKERLLTDTYDTFSEVIGLNWGYMYNVFSIGGDMDMAEKYRQNQLQSADSRRFKPVALFKGPLTTDEEGQATVSFKMPDYIGRVRVMVVGAAGGAYGSREKDITVKSPLMVMPTLPRVLGPEDRIELPVTVFAMEDDLGQVNVNLKLEGPVKVIGEAERVLEFYEQGNKDLFFELEAGAEVGQARITVVASSKEHTVEKTTDLVIRAYNPYTYLAENKVITSGEEGGFTVPDKGIKNSALARLSISPRKNLNLNHRLKWLIRYPYGCIEQTVSSVFPQLYLKELFTLSEERIREIDKNVNTAIERLRTFQLRNGGFSYWPNSTEPDLWGTNYAGHFLLEARNKGYHVPREMMENWVKFQQDKSRENKNDYLTRAYRLYLLSLANREALSALNYLRESRLSLMDNTSRYYLAAGYQLLGYKKIAEEIIQGLGTETGEYNGPDFTYGSALRDKAIMLELSTLFKDYDRALKLYNEIVDEISSDDWYSTQTTAYSLLALSKYLAAVAEVDEELRGKVLLPDKRVVEFTLNKTIITIPLEDCFGREIRVINLSEKSLYTTLEWEGIPLRGDLKEVSRNLTLEVSWYGEDGQEIDPVELEQGTTFWGVFTVGKNNYEKQINEIALVQVLPAGWEIENLRLLGGELPHWMQNLRTGREEYLDIRDDRVMWFFDHNHYEDDYHFAVKLNTVTAGEFYLPPTLVEAMYDNDYKATTSGRTVRVLRRQGE